MQSLGPSDVGISHFNVNPVFPTGSGCLLSLTVTGLRGTRLRGLIYLSVLLPLLMELVVIVFLLFLPSFLLLFSPFLLTPAQGKHRWP